MKPVLILRPEPGGGRTAERARTMGLQPIVAPLFTVRPLNWAIADPQDYDALLLTSANAPRLAGGGLTSLAGLPCYAVGEASAEAARAMGLAPFRIGSGDGADIVRAMASDGVRSALHLCGRDHKALSDDSIRIDPVPVYAAEAVEALPPAAVEALEKKAVAMLHSPRAAQLFGALVGEERSGKAIAAISASAAQAAGPGWAAVEVAREPRDQALLEAAANPSPPQRRWFSYLLLPGLFFLLGIGAMGWILSQWDYAARAIGIQPEPIAAAPVPARARQPAAQAARPAPAAEAERAPETIVIDPEIGRRVAELEQRISQIDTQSRVAVGNADRAEGLLVAFAARRALDRGVALGFLEALLRQRFAATQPQAVGTIITSAREPVTLQELQDGLQQVGPQLIGAGPGQNWWNAFKAELGGLITVRRRGTPSTEPAERLRRATRRLEAGQVDVALAEILRLPGRENAREWIIDARRYVAARRALDTIETAALLEPRTGPVPTAIQQPPLTAPVPRPAVRP